MMKTFWKRTLAVWLAAVLLVASAPAAGIAGMASFLSVTAAAETVSGDCGAFGSNVTWNLDTEAGVLTIIGTGTMADYAYNSSPWVSYRSYVKAVSIDSGVTTIGKYAFYGCTGLTSVTIPDSVTTIGSYAFRGCTGLTSVTIGNSVTRIDSFAFEGCISLASVTIPDSMTSIGSYAFYRCTGLTCVTIPDSVTSIGDEAFSGCTGLTSVTIPDSVTSIGFRTFSVCTGLTSVTIPDSVSSIGSYAFYGVGNIVYSGSATGSPWGAKHVNKYAEGYFVFDSAEKKTLLWCNRTVQGSVIIPDSVTSIGNSAFYYCKGLTSVTIPNSVTSIGDEAFSGCTGLTSVTIPDSVTSIGSYAFKGCTSLTSVTIPDSVTSIGYEAFYGCTGLTSVTIPDSVTSIGSSAFYGCTGLTSVTIPDSVSSIGECAFYRCTGLTSVTIPDSVSSIGGSAFYGVGNIVYSGSATGSPWGAKHVNKYAEGYFVFDSAEKKTLLYCSRAVQESVIIPDSVTSIGNSAFYYCKGLTSVTIPNSVTSIGDEAFSGCTGLTNVTIPDSVTSIGSYAFKGCTSLTSVTIPDSVTGIGIYAFDGVGNIVYSGSTTGSLWGAKHVNKYAEGYFVFDSAEKKTLLWCSRAVQESVIIPDSVTSIGDGAFLDCTWLTSVTIPDSVTSIGSYAFRGCKGLTSVTIPNSVTSIGNLAFSGCTGLTNVTIPDSVTGIGDYAFSGCTGLTSVTIPDSVTGIGGSAFSSCTGISTFAVSVGNTCYTNDEAGVLYNKDKTVLVAYPCGNPRSSFSIPDGVTSINDDAFSGCTGLANVTIPNGVTSIGNGAFRDCAGLTSVTIPNGVTGIGNGAFRDCAGLTSVTIPDSVTGIGNYAFYFCTGLTSVTIPDSVTTIGDNAFYGVGNIAYSGSATGSPWGAEYVNKYEEEPFIFDSAEKKTLLWCSRTVQGAVIIPDSVTSIGNWAFEGCTSLENVTIPDSVTKVGDYAFYGVVSIVYSGSATGSPWGATHGYRQVITQPTCTKGGFKTYTCSVCGDSYTADETPALGHVFSEWIVVQKPSFTSEGLEKHVCTRCGLEETRPIGVLPPDGPTAAAADAVVGCSAGRLVKVTIDMYNNPGIIAARLHVGYDPQQLRLVNVENGTVFDASTFQPGGRLTDVPFTVLWSDDLAHDDVTADGTLVTLTFAVQPTATVGETTVTVTSDAASTLNAALQRMPLATADGTVSIVDCAPGDISGDGELGLLDTVMLSRYLAGGWGVSVNEINADVNGDAVLDLRDVVLIRRFLAGGWDVTLI